MAPGTPILTKIEDEMYNLIAGMTTGDYHYNWGTVNELDMAKMQFPSALIYVEEEESLDDPNGAWSQAYFNEVNFRIEVMARLDREYENPVFEINRELNKCLDDLKKLFGGDPINADAIARGGKGWNLNGTADTMMYSGSRREEMKAAGDIFVPTKLITNWIVRYEQDRTNPDQASL